MNPILLNGTQLNDRFLCFDGDSVFKPDDLYSLILKNIKNPIFIDELTPEIIKFNSPKPKNEKISLKTTNKELNFNWNIPEKYKNINIIPYIKTKFDQIDFDVSEKHGRLKRIASELVLYKQYSLIDFLKVLIYIIDIFKSNNIVWGVGRGSSVSSFILYLLGVHDIDSYIYNLDITDFLR